MFHQHYSLIGVGSLVLVCVVAFFSYYHGYSTCYHELNRLHRNDLGNVVAPGDDTQIVRDLQRECLDLESRLIASQREVQRLTKLTTRETAETVHD